MRLGGKHTHEEASAAAIAHWNAVAASEPYRVANTTLMENMVGHSDYFTGKYIRITSPKACGECAALANKVYDAAQQADFPAHAHCGCTPAPQLKEQQPTPPWKQQQPPAKAPAKKAAAKPKKMTKQEYLDAIAKQHKYASVEETSAATKRINATAQEAYDKAKAFALHAGSPMFQALAQADTAYNTARKQLWDEYNKARVVKYDIQKFRVGAQNLVFNNYDYQRLYATPEQLAAHRKYTSNTYKYMNDKLRGIPIDSRINWVDEANANFKEMFKTVGLTTTQPDTVFRTLKTNPYKGGVGDEFTEPGFMSTSTRKGGAKFLKGRGFNMKINVPEGKRYLLGNSGEHEIIWESNTRFRIDKVDAYNNPIEITIL